MFISVAEAQGQLLDLVRRAEAGEAIMLTHEGKTVAKIDAVAPVAKTATAPGAKPWKQMTPDERLRALEEVVAKIPPMADGGPDAAHSQDFLYDENGLPA